VNVQDRRLLVVMSIAVLVCAGGFLYASSQTYGLGFPLDDAWIHQTYARNLAQRGEWAFSPGVISSGSTSPGWVFLLLPAYLLRVDPRLWSYGLGMLQLFLLGWIGWVWVRERASRAGHWAWLAPLFLILEWHMLWMALSGMEALLYTLLVMSFFLLLERGGPAWKIGMVMGMAVWVRPDGLSLMLPLAIWLASQGREKWLQGLKGAAGLGLLLAPYLAFNLAMGGSPWPTTYYAKQAEYAVLREVPWLARFARQSLQPFVGTGAVLLPGLALVALDDLGKRRWTRLAPLAWALAYLALYATRLPVTYQHGRYAMPTIPVFLLLGVEGLMRLMGSRREKLARLAGRALLASAVVVAWLFWYLGARAYATDVAIIETEMVAASRWIGQNTEQDALIAAHDIGALGYFGGRGILDLAGLVSAEVIPFMRDEEALAEYLDRRGADYLMTFPGWYPALSERGELVYSTAGTFSPAAGGENMAVYRWRLCSGP
jgi:hypothetical protein